MSKPVSVPQDAPARLFVAIDPPPAVRDALAGLPRRIRGVAWTPPEQYHLTLRFIGDVAHETRERIEKALANIEVTSFTLPVEGVGSFPPNRPPRILWAGTGSAHPRLFQLRQKVDDALLACALDLDVRSFQPHFTLARCGRDTPIAEASRFVREHAEFQAPVFRVDAFTLYRSDLRASGAVHTPLLHVPLTAG
ncbi:MAG: RNA 2',3'-cyclic phosphodiesterase [Opitutaceae bacterium]